MRLIMATNFNYIKTFRGGLKLAQILLGLICLITMSIYFNSTAPISKISAPNNNLMQFEFTDIASKYYTKMADGKSFIIVPKDQQFHQNIGLFELNNRLFFTTCVTFLVGTFILFIVYIISSKSENIISDTIYEIFYHLFGFILLVAASLNLVIYMARQNPTPTTPICASVFGIINSILYLFSTVLALDRYKS